MATMHSYTNYENRVVPGLRQNLNKSESPEDVRNFFAHAARELLDSVMEGVTQIGYEDIALLPGSNPPYVLSDRLTGLEAFKAVWNSSDLAQVLARIAEPAVRRYKYLQKNLERTEAKIRM